MKYFVVKLQLFAPGMFTILCAAFLCSCETTSPTSNDGDYKFTVLLFRQPVLASSWKYNAAQNENPEGAALNIVSLMERGDVDGWVASWNAPERPSPSKAERDALLQQWQMFKGARVYLVGRIVAGTDIIIELSVVGPQGAEQKLKFPLQHGNDRWWQTKMDPNSDFMNWENSKNKIVAEMQRSLIQQYLGDTKTNQ